MATTQARTAEDEGRTPRDADRGCPQYAIRNKASGEGQEGSRLRLRRLRRLCRSNSSMNLVRFTRTISACSSESFRVLRYAFITRSMAFISRPLAIRSEIKFGSRQRKSRRGFVSSTACAVALDLRGGLLRRAVFERSRAALASRCTVASGAMMRCQFVGVNVPAGDNLSPATILIKPAVLTYSFKCSFASLLRHPANVDRSAFSRNPGSVILLTRQVDHRLQKSSDTRRCAIASSIDKLPLAFARSAIFALAVSNSSDACLFLTVITPENVYRDALSIYLAIWTPDEDTAPVDDNDD